MHPSHDPVRLVRAVRAAPGRARLTLPALPGGPGCGGAAGLARPRGRRRPCPTSGAAGAQHSSLLRLSSAAERPPMASARLPAGRWSTAAWLCCWPASCAAAGVAWHAACTALAPAGSGAVDRRIVCGTIGGGILDILYARKCLLALLDAIGLLLQLRGLVRGGCQGTFRGGWIVVGQVECRLAKLCLSAPGA